MARFSLTRLVLPQNTAVLGHSHLLPLPHRQVLSLDGVRRLTSATTVWVMGASFVICYLILILVFRWYFWRSIEASRDLISGPHPLRNSMGGLRFNGRIQVRIKRRKPHGFWLGPLA